VNCKQKGYSFGYSYKTIEYKGQTVLDLPQRHLNGSMITFDYQSVPILLHCLENSHLMGTEQQKPAFSMINAKKGATVSKFTYQFSPLLHPAVQKQYPTASRSFTPKLMLYVDVFTYPDKPYLFAIYCFRNRTLEPIENLKFFEFFDFDIYGQDHYKTNLVKFDPEYQVIYQYDKLKGEKNSLIAGIGSGSRYKPSHYEGNTPGEIVITEDQYRDHLRDIDEFGPEDCAVALEWDHGSIYPDQLIEFPVMMVFGFGEKEFKKNCLEAREHLERIIPTIFNSVEDKFRQIIDPELEKMGFSMRQWCKD
jgi:hypothetical protein